MHNECSPGALLGAPKIQTFGGNTPETEGNVMGLFKPTNLSRVLQKNIFVPNMKKYYDLERAVNVGHLKKNTQKTGSQDCRSKFRVRILPCLDLTNYKVILVMPYIQRARCKVNLLISALQLHKEDEPLILYFKPSKTLKIITCVILNIKSFVWKNYFLEDTQEVALNFW